MTEQELNAAALKVARAIVADGGADFSMDFVDVAMTYGVSFGVAIAAVELLYVQEYVDVRETWNDGVLEELAFTRTTKQGTPESFDAVKRRVRRAARMAAR